MRRSSFGLRAIPKNEYDDPIRVGTATITLKDTGKRVEPPPAGDTTPVFAGAAAALSATVGTAITPVVLPAATGDGTLTYSVSALPAGLAFNAATRTISGTPTAAETKTITYTVIDGDTGADLPAESAAQTFTITVAPKPARTVAVQSLTSSHSSIREDAGPTTITLTVTLAAAAPANETVTLDFVAPSTGATAIIDSDYDASLRGIKTITIPVGETVWTGTIPSFAPIDNTKVDGDRSLGVQATASGGSAQTDITITDDETASKFITLSVNPHTISESGGRASVTVTATLSGKALTTETTVLLSVDYNRSTTTRDLDYASLFDPGPQLVIPAGSIRGSLMFIVQPTDDGSAEGEETIRLMGTAAGLTVTSVEITLSDQAGTPTPDPPKVTQKPETPAEGAESSAPSTVVAGGHYTYAVGTNITLVLPEGTAVVSGQPDGLAFDPATRTLSGTPSAATNGPVTVRYADQNLSIKEFTITINPPSSDSSAPSTVVAGGHYTYAVGTNITLVLPEGTAVVSGQPDGLAFDPATRTLSGTPSAATNGPGHYPIRGSKPLHQRIHHHHQSPLVGVVGSIHRSRWRPLHVRGWHEHYTRAAGRDSRCFRPARRLGV